MTGAAFTAVSMVELPKASMVETSTMTADREPRDASAPVRPTVLHVLPQLGQGDVERHCLDIVASLTRARWGVVVASAGGAFVHEVQRAGGLHVTIPLDADGVLAIRRNARRLVDLIRERDVALIHAHERSAAWSGYHAAYRAEIPFVTSFNSPFPPARRRMHRWNAIMAQGARVIVPSRAVGDHVVETYATDAAKIRAIPPGIDSFSFDPRRVSAERLMRLTGTWRLPDGQPMILVPGPIDYGKGLAVVLDAVGRLVRRDLVCILADPGPRFPDEEKALAHLVERHGLAGVVRSVADVKDVPAALMLADVVVTVATAPEAFGRVIAEAQAMGRPVIAADRHGARDLMIAGETAWVVPPDEPGRLTDQLREVLALSSVDRAALADRAMPYARGRFSREKLGEAIIAVYEDVLAEARAAR